MKMLLLAVRLFIIAGLGTASLILMHKIDQQVENAQSR